ncbi:DUF4238 domain-containing protein [Rhizobium leguminosarum]|uniref:DUF4238 domain-containing protein n=1 Tax=Rhizobium leguminosarum TaxID=384 RepID=UPI0010311BA3|nr:DUF4238 domain-containing protein [Rhizobium leguminosarum]TBF35227.1 DUF4238 domain-containing protein [Rhizobium leguminosarum]
MAFVSHASTSKFLSSNFPVTSDITAFTELNPFKGDAGRENKAHHFISVVYMNGFANERGRVQVYRSEAPHDPHPVKPKAVGFENYYYSQKLSDGTQENHQLEDLWNTIETVWPVTVRALEARQLSPAISLNVLGMMAVMRVRVPAARDVHAILMEAKLRNEMKDLENAGRLPARFQRYAGQFDAVPVGINPQRTLPKMSDDFKLIGDLCFRLGFEVIHNRTKIPFLTSDNPVCSYNPRPALLRRVPYDHAGEVELVFPLTSGMLLRGTTKRRPVNMISRHKDVIDPALIRRLNRTIAQFSYRMTLGKDRSSDDLVQAHSGLVPTISTEVRREPNESTIVWRYIFGARPALAQYIDTPEKAARFERQMSGDGGTDEAR